MSQRTELRSHALVQTLPDRVFTRSGASFDPRLDVWEWADGPFIVRLDFHRFSGKLQPFRAPLKEALIPYVKGHSANHSLNLVRAFIHFFVRTDKDAPWPISKQDLANYAASLQVNEKGRLGTLTGR